MSDVRMISTIYRAQLDALCLAASGFDPDYTTIKRKPGYIEITEAKAHSMGENGEVAYHAKHCTVAIDGTIDFYEEIDV